MRWVDYLIYIVLISCIICQYSLVTQVSQSAENLCWVVIRHAAAYVNFMHVQEKVESASGIFGLLEILVIVEFRDRPQLLKKKEKVKVNHCDTWYNLVVTYHFPPLTVMEIIFAVEKLWAFCHGQKLQNYIIYMILGLIPGCVKMCIKYIHLCTRSWRISISSHLFFLSFFAIYLPKSVSFLSCIFMFLKVLLSNYRWIFRRINSDLTHYFILMWLPLIFLLQLLTADSELFIRRAGMRST